VTAREWPFPGAGDTALDVDFVVGQSAAVTLLTESDVAMLDKELTRKRVLAAKGYSRPLILVWKSPVCAEGFLTAQILVTTEFRVPVIPVGSALEAAQFVRAMHEQETHNTPGNTWKPLPDSRKRDDQLLAAVRQVPGVGETTARKLLSRFPSLKHIANADEASLIAWIGDAPGRAVHKFFHTP
jgi:ERCC4-type nuclease